MLRFSNERMIESVLRTAGRSALAVRGEMRRGVNTLATFASAGPLLGLIITVDGIVGSFVGCGGE